MDDEQQLESKAKGQFQGSTRGDPLHEMPLICAIEGPTESGSRGLFVESPTLHDNACGALARSCGRDDGRIT